MDSLVDDGSAKFRKYRVIGMIAPVIILILYILYLRNSEFGAGAIVRAVEAIVIGLAAYYHLKHLVIKDVDYGIIRSIRGYNLLALIYAVLCMLEMILTASPYSIIWTVIVDLLICVILLIFIPVLEKGVKKWTT